MTETTPTLRLWFMDWHGWMLDHNPLKDFPSRSPFLAGSLPGLCAVVPVPLQLPCYPAMEKRVSMPRPFPAMQMQEILHNRVVFFMPDRKTYMRSSPGGHDTLDWVSPRSEEWETFFPLTIEMLRGLSLLLTDGTLRLESDTDTVFPTPTLQNGFMLQFGDRSLPLFLNTAALNQISQIIPGNSARIDLTWNTDTPPSPITVHRQTLPQPETL
ncbi:hypothetical protein JK202_15500 [Gluconobacter sp. Dm-62]|uniref:hypothetical protein n=1 Tax=Gluconobacter sp. Dm-62 TaxID=2799804 RepID=UPI001B8D6342|nr:hypothetical protein [Gluconobacter sp. Dm-62]MBS1104383.1 hypothetical protein [Gluconobacter sp. Dm-62]